MGKGGDHVTTQITLQCVFSHLRPFYYDHLSVKCCILGFVSVYALCLLLMAVLFFLEKLIGSQGSRGKVLVQSHMTLSRSPAGEISL